MVAVDDERFGCPAGTVFGLRRRTQSEPREPDSWAARTAAMSAMALVSRHPNPWLSHHRDVAVVPRPGRPNS